MPLTSEKLRAVIDTAILQAGGLASHTIVAGGKQGCDPHEAGYGPLRANEPIILDIFPRSQKTGYFGDITRTVVRGRASEAVRKLYDTVRQGQKLAFQKMRPGVPTAEVHRTVQEFFEREGYRTGRRNGRMEGFFHGTGHGLGLEIHEAPRVGPNSAGRTAGRPGGDGRAGALLPRDRRGPAGGRGARDQVSPPQPDAVREGAGDLRHPRAFCVSKFCRRSCRSRGQPDRPRRRGQLLSGDYGLSSSP